MKEWNIYKIADIVDEISMGPFGSNIKVENFISEGIPVLNGSNLQGYKLNEESFNYVSEEKANSLGKANAYRGDVVITHRGTLGQIIYIPSDSKFERYVISQSQFRLKLKRDIVRPDFLVYYFHTAIGQHKILMNASQVGVPALARPTSTFREVTLPIPPMDIQNKIMDILLSIDGKLAVNKQINDNLEQQAQTLYKSWFVDFEPFKDGAFKESEFGLIPEGWRVGLLSDLTEITMGQSPSGKSYNETGDGMLFYQGRAEFGDRYPSIRLYTTEPSRIAEQNSVLLSVRAPVGDTNIAYNKCCIGRGLASITAKHGFNSFIFYMIKSLKDQFDLYNGEGTVFGSINRDSLNSMKVIVPTNEVINDFEKIVAPLDFKYKSLFTENLLLTQQRDTLLPKLMSGELKINDLDC